MSKYVKIRSYHLASGLVSRSGRIFTLCGRWAAQGAETWGTLPADKSCESCLRNQAIRDE